MPVWSFRATSITVNLAPADLPKDSGRFYFPIALGILAASGQIDALKLAGYEFAGELSLGGGLRPVRGSLAMSLAIARQAHNAPQKMPRLVLPEGSAQHLLDVVRQFLPGDGVPEVADGWVQVVSSAPSRQPAYPDLADVKDQAAAQRAEFPASFQLIAAMNPYPCGYLGSSLRTCRCSPEVVARYQGKLSGPLLDRIDLHVKVGSLAAGELVNAPPGESTEAVRSRVAQARNRAMERQGSANQTLEGQAIDAQCQLDPAAAKFLNVAATRLGWSGRGIHCCLKVARTIADLAGAKTMQITHVAKAVQYRRVLKAAQ